MYDMYRQRILVRYASVYSLVSWNHELYRMRSTHYYHYMYLRLFVRWQEKHYYCRVTMIKE